jgi:hypothetical protein
MLADGLDATRVQNVQGIADQEPLVKDDPKSARNRRISIILLKQSLTTDKRTKKEIAADIESKNPKKPAAANSRANASTGTNTNNGTGGVAAPASPRKREPGVIYFP